MSSDEQSTPADRALAFAGSFEAELLLELMLRHWKHPLADNSEFRNNLLEAAAEVLFSCCRGEQLIEEISPGDMNFVAAVWYIESTGSHEDCSDARVLWAETLRKTVPACFCDEDRLF